MTHPLSADIFNNYKVVIERVIGTVLIAFGLKVATTSNG
jgi:threonine/homoserine/homoserine lactone efflux protein